jgi:hypothetical protein
VKGRYNQKIKDTKVANKKWAQNHWEIIKSNYKSAKAFKDFGNILEQSYLQCEKLNFLSDVNMLFLNLINSIIGIKTLMTDSSKYKIEGNRNEKLISICKQANAQIYVTGPSAKDYINEKLFSESEITIQWINYNDYPEYRQNFPPFEHSVSIIDVILNNGVKSTSFLKSFQ